MEHQFQLLILQIAVILLLSRLLGQLVRLLHQPQVIGEMLAGIVLGPSVLGQIDGGRWMNTLFPAESQQFLQIFSQFGVMVFMFLIGLELDLAALRAQGRTVVAAGFASILGPLAGGLAVGYALWRFGGVQGEVPSPVPFVLFVATTLSISAFPVLARILSERNLQKTKVGALALACAAINDVLGWCILAVVLDAAETTLRGGIRNPGMSALFHGLRTALLAAVYAIFMVMIVRRFLGRLQAHFESRGYLTQNVLAIVFLLLLASSFATQTLGIHLIFGAFMFGAVMPSEPRFVRHVASKTEDFTLLFLLPIFFTYTGLKTDLTQLNTGRLWAVWGLLLAAAVALKISCSLFAARWSGLAWRPAALLGVLMNTHGLMELIVINLGLQIGAISRPAFSMLVAVLLTTTLLTTPLIRLLYSPARQKRELELAAGGETLEAGQKILVPVSLPAAVPGLLRLSRLLLADEPGRLYLLHLERPDESELRQRSAFMPRNPLEVAQETARSLQIPINTESRVSRAIGRDISVSIRAHHAAWTVMGWHKPVFVQSVLGGTVGVVLRDAPGNVAILVDKGLDTVQKVLVPYLGEAQDVGAMLAAERLGRNAGIQVTILHVVSPQREHASRLGVQQLIDRHLPAIGTANQVHMQVVESPSPIDVVTTESHRYDLIVLGISPQWRLVGGLLGSAQESVAQLSACSLLIVRADPLSAGHES